jgi:prevent-host-death family protein
MRFMAEVTIRELRNHGGEVVDRAARGEQITITRAGKPVAELRPVPPRPLAAEALLTRWHRLPPVDYRTLRAELDEVMDPGL